MDAANVASIRAWVAVNRPDLVSSFDRIIRMEARGQEEGLALLALIVIGWAAGRQYQREHPEDTSRAAPARELYRSPLFRLSLAYAERVTEEVYVLSAQHGLVALDQVLEPYDLALSEMDAWERAWWAHEVEAQLAGVLGAGLDPKLGDPEVTDPIESEWFLHDPRLRVVLLAGKLYRPGGFVERYLEEPLAGMGIGERLSWLKSQVVEAQPEVA